MLGESSVPFRSATAAFRPRRTLLATLAVGDAHFLAAADTAL
jgi:hypothetical protein